MNARRLLVLGALACLTVGIASCGSEQPAQEPTPSQRTTPTPAPEVLAPEGVTPQATPAQVDRPDPADFPGMDQQTEQGAQQAFAHYWAVAITANQDGDTTALSRLAAEGCAACAQYEEQVAERLEKDQLWPAATLTTDELGMYEEEGVQDVVLYRFTVTFPSQDARTPEPASYVSVGGLEWTEEGWKVLDFALQSTDA